MKRRLGLGLLGLVLILAACGGGGSARRDWRHPPRPCTTDEQCNGGKCVLGPDATEATCTGGSAPLPALPPGSSAPASPSAPAPSIQPSPSDIQI
jgi:hypothetical protein